MKEIKSDKYSLWVGENSLSKLDISSYSKVAILVDENTERDCLGKLPNIESLVIISIDSGEENKNIDTCNFIWEQLTKNQFDRNSLMINLGGGVIGDIGGFCAATYKRSIDFIHIPTTLLSMVDASIGGKLGVNHKGLKNLIGVFNNPKSVLIFPDFLETLPENELKSGFAEVVKHSLIASSDMWSNITSTHFNKLIWEDIILESLEIKNNIILADPIDLGIRKKLNFGHTYAHAIECYYLQKGTPVLHGEAVLMGIILELELSPISNRQRQEVKNYITSNFSLPSFPKKSSLVRFLSNDKKNMENKINFSLLNKIGECSIDNLISINEL